MTELELIRDLARRLPAIGDDCAILPHGKEDLLFKVDMLIEDVHFRRKERTAADVGYRALARALSDIAAMGGRPKWALVALALPPWATPRWIRGFYDGFLGLANQHKTELVGGDLSHANQLVVDVFVAGVAPHGQALRRSTARAGDELFVSGPLGKQRWRFEPRLALGQQLRRAKSVTACMDLSDGLSLDLHRLAEGSGLEAALDFVPVQRGATLQQALHHGEDYELLFAQRPGRKAPNGCHCIGRLVSGPRPGRLMLAGAEVPQLGYDHLKQT